MCIVEKQHLKKISFFHTTGNSTKTGTHVFIAALRTQEQEMYIGEIFFCLLCENKCTHVGGCFSEL